MQFVFLTHYVIINIKLYIYGWTIACNNIEGMWYSRGPSPLTSPLSPLAAFITQGLRKPCETGIDTTKRCAHIDNDTLSVLQMHWY